MADGLLQIQEQGKSQEVEITPEACAAAVRWLREEFYPCAWGSDTKAISEAEADALVSGVVSALAFARAQG